MPRILTRPTEHVPPRAIVYGRRATSPPADMGANSNAVILPHAGGNKNQIPENPGPAKVAFAVFVLTNDRFSSRISPCFNSETGLKEGGMMAKKKSRRAGAKKTAKKQKTTLATCNSCPALCCYDLAMHTTRPRTKDEIDNLKWHVQYDTVHVAVRSHRWYIVVKGRCQYLDKDNRCTIYARRPQTCRRHMPRDCERFGKWYDHWISSPEELDKFLNKRRRR